jgi:hypothetical protein
MSGLSRKSTDTHGRWRKIITEEAVAPVSPVFWIRKAPHFGLGSICGLLEDMHCLLWGDYVAVEHPISDRHNGHHMMDGIFDEMCKLMLTLYRLGPKISTSRQTFTKCFFVFPVSFTSSQKLYHKQPQINNKNLN